MTDKKSIVQYDALRIVPDEFAAVFGAQTPILIADKNTWAAAGQGVYDAFASAGTTPEKILFPDTDVYADYGQIEYIKKLLSTLDGVPLAVGSGSLNDIVKRASFELKRAYALVPTAPSVDGFAATGAAVSVDGFKTTLPCDSPRLIVADIDVLRNAPADMISAGYGDVFAKVPAGADWKIAELLGIEAVDPAVWDIVQGPLKARIAHPELLLQRNGEAVRDFYTCLIDVGHAMEMYKESRPASGAEHLFSHILEMDHLTYQGKIVSHGFKVAIGTLISSALMTDVLSFTPDTIIDSGRCVTDWDVRYRQIQAAFDESLPSFGAIVEASRQKFCADRTEKIRTMLPQIQAAIRSQVYSFEQVKDMLRTAGCPVAFEDIGITGDVAAAAVRRAQMIRKRYTVLDLLYESGQLDRVIDRVTGSGEYF